MCPQTYKKTSNVRPVMLQQVIKTLQKIIWFLFCLPYNYVGLKTYNLECESHKADCRRSIRRIEPSNCYTIRYCNE